MGIATEMRDRASSLNAWFTEAAISPQLYERVQTDPNYARTVRRFAADMLAEGDADRALDGLLKDAGRNFAAMCAAYLHVTGGLTLPRLKALCLSTGLVSPGRARALLIYLRYLGYVELLPTHSASGATAYRPTAGFLQRWRSHMRRTLHAVQILEPAVGALLEVFDEPGVFETYVDHMTRGFLEGTPPGYAETAYFRVFMHRNAGIQLVHLLIAKSEDGDDFPPRHPISVSISAAARRFGVSRVHLRRMLDAAEAEGLLSLTGQGAVVFEPLAREAMDHLFATQLIRFLNAAAHAWAARSEPAVQPERLSAVD